MARKKKPDFPYTTIFDKAMSAAIGEPVETHWNVMAGSWGGFDTRRMNGKPLTKTHVRIGRAISDALAEAKAHYGDE